MNVKANIAFPRLAGVAGIAFAGAIVLANVVLVPAGLPATGAAPADVIAFFSGDGTALAVASALMPTAWVAAVVFGAGVVVRERNGWAVAGFAGLVLQNAAFTGVAALRLALPEAGPAVAPAFWALHDALFTLNGVFLALALAGLTACTTVLPGWQTWLGYAAAALLFVSATLTPWVVAGGPLTLLGLTGWLLWVVWLVAYGIALLRRASTA
ncbi:hypothetical protein ACFWNN_16235 [Lentzea sp. NPDC058450]|uniref:hypothetical protein n=1 Tax=Lentzea sp. NPDC058450 TaxID=3346505 RepID=UPI003660B5E6